MCIKSYSIWYEKPGFVTYADLLYIARPDKNVDYPDEYYKYGWVNLFYAKVEYNYDGKWILKMPRTRSLKEKKIRIN